MLPTLVSGAVSLVSTWLVNKKEKQKAIHEKTIEVIHTASSWEELQAKNAESSWKDEWFSIVLSIPLLGAFFPPAVPFINEGFLVLASMPDFYKLFLGAAVASSFGVKALTKWGSK